MCARVLSLALCLALGAAVAGPGIAPARAQSGDTCTPAERAPAGTLRLSELRRQIGGEIVRAAICRVSDQWVYRVTVLEPSGQVRTMVFDAANGKSLNR